jgi:hypothetical protein
VPTLTFNIVYVFFVLSLQRRRVLHVNVTAHPYAAWTAHQIVEAIGADFLPAYWCASTSLIITRTDRTWRSAAMRRLRALLNHRAQAKSSHFPESGASTTDTREHPDRAARLFRHHRAGREPLGGETEAGTRGSSTDYCNVACWSAACSTD